MRWQDWIIFALLAIILGFSMANFIKPPSATIYQGMFQAIGQMAAENLIMRNQLNQAAEQIENLKKQVQNKK